MVAEPEKTCSKCREVKKLTEFSRHIGMPDGHQYNCKSCYNLYRAQYGQKNKQRILEYGRTRYANNKQHCARVSANWRMNNLTRCRANERARYAANTEAHREKQRKWRYANASKNAAYAENRRARQVGAFVENVLLAVLAERDGNVCGICRKQVVMGHSDIRFRPSIDHIIPLSKGGQHSYANTQLAHRSCNSSKGVKILVP